MKTQNEKAKKQTEEREAAEAYRIEQATKLLEDMTQRGILKKVDDGYVKVGGEA